MFGLVVAGGRPAEVRDPRTPKSRPDSLVRERLGAAFDTEEPAMAFRQRRDATPVAELPALRRIVPYVMPTRGEATVYFQQRIEADRLVPWLADQNTDRGPEDRITLFHVVLTGIARTLMLRPEVNRFVAGRRTYARWP
jgi:hypothetical protein